MRLTDWLKRLRRHKRSSRWSWNPGGRRRRLAEHRLGLQADGLEDRTLLTVDPVFGSSGYSFEVSEAAMNGDPVGTVSATDPQSQTVTYSLDDGGGNPPTDFGINSSTGTITVAAGLDASTQSMYYLTVIATDPDGNTGTATVDITVSASGGGATLQANGDSYSATENTTLVVNVANGVLNNDTGDTLTAAYMGGTGPSNGTLDVFNSDGSFEYTPSNGFTGTDTFDYEVTDAGGMTEMATVTITVSASTNSAPVANVDWMYRVDFEQTLNVAAAGILANDTDPDGDTLTAVLESGVSNGTLTLNSDGSLTYTPNSGFTGIDSFTYRADDGTSQSDPSTVSFNVLNPPNNFAPVSTNDSHQLSHDTTLTIAADGVLQNDTDWEEETLTAVLVGDVTDGTLSLNSNGSFSYTPTAGFVGTDSFTYRASDGTSTGNLATVVLNVKNEAPTARNDYFHRSANTVLSIDASDGVLENDTDPEGDSLIAVLDSSPANGTLAFNSDGSLTYTPNANFVGNDSFTYHADDGTNESSVATVTIVVSAGPPATTADLYYISHDRSLTVAAADGVLDNDTALEAMSAALVAGPENGTLTFNADGSFDYASEADFVGTDSFTYTATDLFGTSRETTVTINVVNEAPSGRPESYTTSPGVALNIDAASGVLGNDADLDSDTLSATLVTSPADGTLSLAADGSFTYTPNAGFNGVDSFVYQAGDGLALSDEVTVTLHVSNTVPVAVGETFSVPHGQTLQTTTVENLLLNDYDADGDTLSFSTVSNPTYGTLSLNPADGTFAYTPNAGFAGTDSFTYVVTDGFEDSESVTVEIEVTNTNPWATDRQFSVIRDASLVEAVPGLLEFAGDADNDTLTISVTDATDSGTLVIQQDGSFTYTPSSGFTGTDEATVEFADPTGATATATITFVVGDTAPTAGADLYAAVHDQALSVAAIDGVLANDEDADGQSLSATLLTNVTNGTLTLNTDGSFTYTPNSGFHGTESFTYRASDGNLTADANVTILVAETPPAANGDEYGVLLDETLSVNAANGVLANDTDPDGDTLTVELVDDVSNGTLTLNTDGAFTYVPATGFTGTDRFTYQALDGFTDPDLIDPNDPESDGKVRSNIVEVAIHVCSAELGAQPDEQTSPHDQNATGNVLDNDFNWTGAAASAEKVTDPANGTVTLAADGSYTYTPNTGFVGTDTWTYKYKRDDGTLETSPATVTMNIVNTAPAAFNRQFGVSHGQTLAVAIEDGLVSTSADDEGDTITATLVAAPTEGSLTLNADGSFDYTPTLASFVGTDTFTYKVSDGIADSTTVTVTIDVTNATPVARDAFYVGSIDQVLTVSLAAEGVLANDFDDDGDALQATLVSNASNGTLTLNADGTFTYTPNTGFTGTDSFTYTAGDSLQNSTAATVEITVSNSVPSGQSDEYTVIHDQTLVIDAEFGVVANDIDWDGDTITAVLESGPTFGTLTLNADGSFTYTPNAGSTAADSFTYRADDGFVVSEPITVAISVTNVAPEAHADRFFTHRNEAITIPIADILINDSDADEDTISYALDAGPADGTLTDNGNGTLTYTPDAGFAGIASWTYTVSDGLTSSTTTTVEVEVANSEPTAWEDQYTVAHDTQLNVTAGDLFINDFDLNGDALSAQLVSGPSHGTLTLNTDGSFTYTPDEDYVGSDWFEYTINDGIDTSDPAVVTLTVENTAPVARPDAHQIVHDTTLTVAAADGLIADSIDAEDDALTVDVVAQPVYGTLTVQADGEYEYEPNAGFVGTDSFAYRVGDGIDYSDVVTVTVTVNNAAPAASIDFHTMAQNSTLTVNAADGVLTNDVDVDQDTLTATLESGPHDGTLTFNSDGSFEYTPDTGFAGRDQFTYELTDGVDTTWATVLIEVTGTNQNPQDAPVAGDDVYRVAHDGTLEIDPGDGVTAGDYDPTGDWLTATLVGGTSNGTLSFNADGSFDYTPNSGFTGTDSFTYKASDGTETSNTATVTIHVENSAPTVSNVVRSVHQGSSLVVDDPDAGLMTSARDQDDDTLTLSVVSGPSNGSLSFNSDGTYTYTPNSGFAGTDSFTWKANDGVTDSASATVTINVTNNRPFVAGRQFQTQHDESLNVTAGGLLSAAGDYDGDELTAVLVTGPANGTLSLNADGTFTYTPNANKSGKDSFEIAVDDGVAQSDSVKVTIDIQNVSPDAADASHSVHHGTSITVSAPAWDADGDALTISVASGGNPSNGSVQISGTSMTYTPNAGFTGEDSVTFSVTDGISDLSTGAPEFSSGTITFTVTNTSPTVESVYRRLRPNETLNYDAAQGLLSLARDADEDALSLGSGVAGTHDIGIGSLVVAADGSYTFTPDANADTAVGEATFSFTVTDGADDSDSADLVIRVVNETPFALDRDFRQHASVVSSGSASYSFHLADPWPSAIDLDGDPVTYKLDGAQPAEGTVVLNTDGSGTFTPTNATFTGSVTFQYLANDGFQDGDPATVTIKIENNDPTANNDSFTSRAGNGTETKLTITRSDLLRNDHDFDGDELTISIDDTGLNGTLTYVAETGGEEEHWEFAPADDFVGDTQFDYTVTDGIGQSDSATAVIHVINSAPWGIDRYFQIDVDEQLTVASLTGEGIAWDLEHDTLSATEAVGSYDVTLDPQNEYGFTFEESTPGIYDVKYTLNDGTVDSTVITITIEVVPDRKLVIDDDPTFSTFSTTQPGYISAPTTSNGTSPLGNTAPEARSDGIYRVEKNTAFSSSTNSPSVLNNDRDPDEDTMTITVITGPAHGTFSMNTSTGHFTYTPVTDYVGYDQFSYKVTDSAGNASETVLVDIDVWEEETTPTPGSSGNPIEANPDTARWSQGTLTGDVSVNDYVLNGPGVYSATYSGSGTFSMAADGTFSFTPADGKTFAENGGATVTYTLTDDNNDSVQGTLEIKPRILKPGESITNAEGTVTAENSWQNGVLDVMVWLDSDTAYFIGGSPTAHYEIRVLDADNPGNPNTKANAVWYDGGASLYLHVENGDIKLDELGSFVPGDFVLEAFGGDVDFTSNEAASLLVNASGDISDVDTFERIFMLHAGGNIGNIVGSDTVYSVWSNGSVGNIQVFSGNLWSVHADTGVGDINVSTGHLGSLGIKGSLASDVTVSSDIGSIFVGDDIAAAVDITAGGAIGEWKLDHPDVFYYYDAATQAAYVTDPLAEVDDLYHNSPLTDFDTVDYTGVFVGGKLEGKITATSDSIAAVYADDDITTSALISAARTLLFLGSKNGSVAGTIVATGDNLGLLYAGVDIKPQQITVGKNAVVLKSLRDLDLVSAPLTVSQSIGSIWAGRNLAGNFTATAGSIEFIHAAAHDTDPDEQIESHTGDITSGSFTAAGRIGVVEVLANDGVTGSIGSSGSLVGITSSTDLVGYISAPLDIHADADAALSLGSVVAGTDVTGIYTAGASIGKIDAETGIINAEIDSGEITGPVTAAWLITGTIDGANIVEVTSENFDIDAELNADIDIGNVTAGGNISLPITATAGNIGVIHAGVTSSEDGSAGNITGAVNAGGNLAGIYAAVTDESLWNFEKSWTTSSLAKTIIDWDPENESENAPRPDRPAPPPSATSGNILGNVNAGKSIGFVFADGRLTGNVDGADRVDFVWTTGDIDSLIESSESATAVISGGRFSGSLNTTGDSLVAVYDNLDASISASNGFAYTNTFLKHTGDVTGALGVAAWSFDGSESNLIKSSNGVAILGSMGDVSATTVEGHHNSAISVLGRFQGSVISHNGNVVAGALKGLRGTIKAHNNAFASSIGSIEADVKASAGEGAIEAATYTGSLEAAKSIYMNIEHAMTASLKSTGGDIYVAAKSIGGADGKTSIVSSTGRVGLVSYGDLAAQVSADKGVAAWAKGKITGNGISTNGGSVVVTALGNIDSDISAQNGASVSIVGWNELNGDVTARNASGVTEAIASVGIFTYSDVDGKVTADGHISVTTWGEIRKDVTSKNGSVTIFARHGLNANASAGNELTVITTDNVTGQLKAGLTDTSGSGTIVADGDFVGSLTAAKNAVVDVLGYVSADVTANSGSGMISAFGNVSGSTLKAPKGKATVTTGGAISQTTVTAGSDATVTAHGAISSLTAVAQRTAIVLGDTDISTTTVKAGTGGTGSAIVAALDSISSNTTITAANGIDIVAGNNATVTATAGDGPLYATVRNDLSGTFEGRGIIDLAAHGKLTGVTANTPDNVSLFAGGSAASNATAGGRNIDVTSLGELTASLNATGTTTVYVDGDFLSSGSHAVTSTGDVAILLNGALQASVSSGNGTATVVTIGVNPQSSSTKDINGNVSGHNGVVVSNFGGSVSGNVSTENGMAAITARGAVSGTVTATKGTALIRAVGNVTGATTAGKHAIVATLGSSTANVTAQGGNAIVAAGVDVQGEISAQFNALVVAATGEVAETVTATNGSSQVIASGSVIKNVTAGLHTGVYSLAAVTGSVTATAGHVLAIATGGNVAGAVNAGLSAVVLAYDDVQGDIVAGTDILTVALANQSGTVSAGRDALVITGENVTSAVTAARHAVVFAAGHLTNANITATTGVAFVTAFGSITNTVTAGDDAILLGLGVGDAVASTVTAGNDTYVEALGPATLFVNATQDAWVFTGGLVTTGSVTAGRDAGLFAMSKQVGVSVDAGRDAGVFSFGHYEGDIDAGRDAGLISLDQVSGSTVSGVRDAFAASIDVMTTVIVDGGRFAGMISWDMIGGPSLVTGVDGAFAWTYGSFYGDVRSTVGWAMLTAYGDIFLSSVIAETDALVIAVSDFHIASDITAGESVFVISLGDFEGLVSAGDDAILLGEGDFNVGLEAGNDVFVYAEGDITGSYTAGRDISALTFGDFNAGLFAARDVGGSEFGIAAAAVWAKGNITGVIDAGRNVGGGSGSGLGGDTMAMFENGVHYPVVFAGGTINADIYARNTTSDPDGGRIGRVGAHGDIDGLFKAESSIDEVFSAGDIFAILDAPLVYPPRENDASVITDYPLPATPTSIRAEVLADAAIAYTEVLDARDELFEAFEEFLDAMRDIEAEVHDEVANARTATFTENARLQAVIEKGLETATEQSKAYFAAEVVRLQSKFNEIRASAAQELAEFSKAVADAKSSRAQGYEAAQALRQRRQELMETLDERFANNILPKVQDVAEKLAEKHRLHFANQRIAKRIREWNEEQRTVSRRLIKAFAGRYGDKLDQIVGTPSGEGYVKDVQLSVQRLASLAYKGWKTQMNVQIGFVKAAFVMVFDAQTVPLDLAMVSVETVLLRLGYRGFRWKVLSFAGRGNEQAFQNGQSLSDIYVDTGLNMVTLGGYGAYQSYQHGMETGDYTQFEQDLGGVGFNVIMLLAGKGRIGKPHARKTYRNTRSKARNSVKKETTTAKGKGCFVGDTLVWYYQANDTLSKRSERFEETLPDAEFAPDDLATLLIIGSVAGIVVLQRRSNRQLPTDRTKRITLNRPHSENNDDLHPSWLPNQNGDDTWRRTCEIEPTCDNKIQDTTLASTDADLTPPAADDITNIQAAAKPTDRRKPMSRLISPLLWLALLSGLATSALGIFRPHAAQTEPVATPRHSTTPLQAKPIRDITVGTWVRSGNPTGEEDLSLGASVDPKTWRQLELRAPKADGSHADVTLLRPLSWIDSKKVVTGGTAYISVPECGIDGNALVLSIRKCPPITPSPGEGYRVVTGKFVHHSAQVIDVHVEGQKGPIGTTANHPFWSEDKQKFVRADELRPGERLRAFNGTPVVVSVYPRPGPQTVYNLEVAVDHTYCVASNGLLVHNGDVCPKIRRYMRQLRERGIVGEEAKRRVRERFPSKTSWNTARKNFWKDVALSEIQNPTRKYSVKNIRRMLEGKAPRMRVRMKNRKTGEVVVRDIPIELHHRSLYQRGKAASANQSWNLEPVSRWAHEAMDPYRHAGWDLVSILEGPNSYE